jgi:hypothetical protein
VAGIPRALAVAVLAAFALPATAAASTYCVNTSGSCDQSFGATQLQDALDAAGTHSSHDLVRIGPGTYARAGGFSYDVPAEPVNTIDIDGAGSAQTTITASSGNDLTALLVNTNHPIEEAGLSHLSDLGVHVPDGTNNTGLEVNGATATRVVVAGGAGLASGTGLALGGRFERSTVSMPMTVPTLGVSNGGVGATVADSLVVAQTGIVNTSDVGATSYVRRSEIRASAGLGSDVGGTLVADNDLIRLGGTMQVGVRASGSALTPKLNGDHLTILGDETAGSSGVAVVGPASATVTNSIINRVDHGLLRDGSGGAADLTVSYSDYDAATNSDGGSGTLTQGPGNLNVDPLFVGASNFHLQPASPVIDAGDPAACGGTDRDGNPRVVDGDDDGSARTDMGAFERQSDGKACPAAAPPAPPPRPQPAIEPGAAGLADHSVRLKRKRIPLEIACAPGADCEGDLNIATAKRVSLPKKKIVRLGTAGFAIPAGQTEIVKVKLPKRGRRLFKRKRRVKAKAALTTAAAGVAPRTVIEKLRIKRSKRGGGDR